MSRNQSGNKAREKQLNRLRDMCKFLHQYAGTDAARTALFIWGDRQVAVTEEGWGALDRLEAEAQELLIKETTIHA